MENNVTADGELKMADTEHQKEQDDLRRAMQTLPNLNVENKGTDIFVGVEGITVECVDKPRNPYRTIVEVATATWGDAVYATRWPLMKPVHRFNVVRAALSGNTLPQAIEPNQWTFIVRGAARSEFDQHARQRLATFFSSGCRDNSRIDSGWRCPTELHPSYGGDKELYEDILAYLDTYKKLYARIMAQGAGSFQSARSLMPMGAIHPYKFSANLGALKSYIAQRTQACEQEGTVQVAISVWHEVNSQFPLIASYLKPGCDLAKSCTYHKNNALSEAFGCLFKGCGRWPDNGDPYATFNKSCSDYETMGKQSGKPFPSPANWKTYDTYESLHESDKILFSE